MSRFALLLIFCCIVFVSLSCDRGLEPPPLDTKATITGRIFFSSPFPPCDSSKILAVVLVEAPSPYTPLHLVKGIADATVLTFILDNCSFRDTAYSFSLTPKTYRYLGVAQNFGIDLTKDWRVVGFAHDSQDSARIFDLQGGDVLNNIDIHVRFDSLVRQPFIQ
jgi:hypothetical protein